MAEYFYQKPTDDEIREFWSKTIRPRESVMELNFAEKAVTLGNVAQGGRTTFIDEKAWTDIVLPAFSSEWHDPGRDEIKNVILYSDDTYLCFRSKMRYEFDTNTTRWQDYTYKKGNVSELKTIYETIRTVAIIQKEARDRELLEEVRKLNLEALDYFYDSKWYKKMDEIQKMLLYSDWRVLPDAPQKWDGERDAWVTWRQRLRDLLPDNPRETFEDNFAMFKFLQTLKYPVDPRVWATMYPDRDVEYLSTDDQFKKYDFEVSKDFVGKTQLNLIEFLETYDANTRPIEAKVLELAKALRLETVYEGLDYEKFVAE